MNKKETGMKKLPNIKTIDSVFYKELGSVLRKCRGEKDMTLKELSKEVGIPSTTLDYYELGLVKIKQENLDLICKALEINNGLKVEVKLKDS